MHRIDLIVNNSSMYVFYFQKITFVCMSQYGRKLEKYILCKYRNKNKNFI